MYQKVSTPAPHFFNFRAEYFGYSFATTCRAHRILATVIFPRSNLKSVNHRSFILGTLEPFTLDILFYLFVGLFILIRVSRR